MESPISDAIMSPEEELDGCEPDPLGKRPAVRPLPLLVGEASNNSPGSDGSLPSTPPPAEEEEDELYRQSLEIISQYLREQATGAKDAKPLGGSGTTSRKALETLRRVGDGVQRNHETAFQGMFRKLDIKNEDDVKSLSRVMVHVFSDGVTNGQDCDSYFFWCLCGQTLEGYKSRKLHRTTSRKHHRCCRKVKTRLDSQTERLGWVCGVLPRRGPRRRHQKCAAGFCRCCRSRSWFGISNKIAF